MSETMTCGKCGTELLANAAGGLCPRCLMAMNFDSRTMPEEEAPRKTAPLSPDEMRAHFPQFDVLECLGRGGMGVVYKARQKTLDRPVAIKVLAGEWQGDPGFAARFEKEAKTLAQMSHPNIVTVHDFGKTADLFFIVMEYIDGVNLRDLLREGKMEPEQALAIIPPICQALEYAHDKGVVHRDIKPENILLDREGRVKIADFGIASLVGATGEKSGTPPYMAPEQESGRVDRRADIYALGAVLYEMLTGERPDKELVAPSKKVQIDVRLDEIVLRALEKFPELRYQTAGEFKTRVETLVSTMGDSTDPVASLGVLPAERKEESSGGKPPAEASTTATLSQLWTICLRQPGKALKAIGLGVLASIVAHLMAFGAAEGVGHELLELPLSANHFIYPAVEGLFASFAILGIVINCRKLPAKIIVGATLACLSTFCYTLPTVGVEFDTELPLMLSILANFILFPVYFLQLLVKRTGGGPSMEPTLAGRNPLGLAGTAGPATPSTALMVYLLAYAGFGILLAATSSHLPPQVASHFGAEGRPNGWMSRATHLVFLGFMPLLFGGMAVLVSWMTRRLHARFINIPRRDFWLTPERRPETAAFLRRRMFWLAVLMTLFFAGLHLLTLNANQSTPAKLSMDGLLTLIIAFLLAMMFWIVSLLMRLAEVEKPLSPQNRTAGMARGETAASSPGSAIAPPARRNPWPIWLTFGTHAMMLLGLAGVLVFSIPRFTAMVDDLGIELPVVTQLVLGISRFTVRGGYLLFPVLILMNFPLCWLAEKLGGRKLLAVWAVLGVVVLLGLGGIVIGSTFLLTSRMMAIAAEEQPGTSSTPAEFRWREVAVPPRVQRKWEPFGAGPTRYFVLTLDQPPVTTSRYALIGEIMCENVEGTAYLEMWSHFPESGKYFTRTLAPPGSGPMAAITGSSNWRPFTLPFDRSNTTEPLSKIEVNLHLPSKGVVYLRGLRLVEDPEAALVTARKEATPKTIPPEAARLFEELRQVHESPEFKNLLQNAPNDPTSLERYNEEINRRLVALKQLLRGTAAEQAMAESLALSEQMKQSSAVGGIDAELIKRAEVVGNELESMLKAAATTPKPVISVEISGLVVRPGKVSLRSDATLLDALAAAGGWTGDGNLHARIFETDENHFIEVTSHDIQAILEGRAINPSVPHRGRVILSEPKP